MDAVGSWTNFFESLFETSYSMSYGPMKTKFDVKCCSSYRTELNSNCGQYGSMSAP